jgi:hypothetical protein
VEEQSSIPRHRWLAMLAPIAIAALLSGLLAYVLYAAPLGEHVRLDRSSMRSHEPDIAASRDGEYVAVAWSDGYISTAEGQGYVYLSYGSETKGGWPRVKVYPATASLTNLAKEPAIVFDPRAAHATEVHMAWSQNVGSTSAFNNIYYASCNLANPGTCKAGTISPVSVRPVGTGNVFMPDVAVDKTGGRHVVWLEESGTNTAVKYASSSNGTTWTPQNISLTSNYTSTQPAMAYANVGSKGCLHIVWAGGSGGTFNHIGYKRKDLGGSDCGGDKGPLYFNLKAGHSVPKNPSVAASGSTVYIVWDVDSGNDDGTYQYYYLVYNSSNDSGETWARDPSGTAPEYLDFPGGGIISFTNHLALDETESGRTRYGSRLRPNVTLEVTNTLVVPHIVWNEVVTESQEGMSYHYDVFHTIKNPNWVVPATNATDGTKDIDTDSAAPEVVVGKKGHVHVTYMEETRGSGSDRSWNLIFYQGPIVDTGSELYLPIIFKNSG